MLGGFGVVVTEQMQDAVHGQELEFLLSGMPRLAGLGGGHLRAEHDIAEQGRAGLSAVRALPVTAGSAELRRDRGPQLVHGERQHVGRPRLTHPALMQASHDLLVHEQHRELG